MLHLQVPNRINESIKCLLHSYQTKTLGTWTFTPCASQSWLWVISKAEKASHFPSFWWNYLIYLFKTKVWNDAQISGKAKVCWRCRPSHPAWCGSMSQTLPANCDKSDRQNMAMHQLQCREARHIDHQTEWGAVMVTDRQTDKHTLRGGKREEQTGRVSNGHERQKCLGDLRSVMMQEECLIQKTAAVI